MIRFLTALTAAALMCTTVQATDFDKADKLAAKIPGSATKTVEAFASYLKNNLDTPEEQVRATYLWMTKNMGYDKGREVDLITLNASDSVANIIIKKKKGSASDFAELFHKVCLNLGIEGYMVAGYLKADGATGEEGHAWNAIHFDDDSWLLYDTMLGTGTLNKGKFTKKQSLESCNVAPETFIKTHMPFDPAWQLVANPIKAEAFYKGQEPSRSGSTFSFADTISYDNQLLRSEQLEALCRRLKWAGDVNRSTSSMLGQCQQIIPSLKEKERYAREYRNITAFNGVATKINVVISYYNKFTAAKKKLKAKGTTIPQLKVMMDSCNVNIAGAQLLLAKLSFDKEEQVRQKDGLVKTVADLQKQLDIENAFLARQKAPATKKKKR